MRHVLLSVSLATALVGCNRNDDPAVATDAALYRFAGCGELEAYVADAWLETLVQAHYGGAYAMMEDGASPPAAGDDGAAADGPTDFSETNNQEAGVDEPDIVKTDGDHVYVVQQQRAELTIVKSWPVEEAEVLGRIPLDGYPMSMFLEGDRVVVFSMMWGEWGERGESESPWRDGYATRLTVVDVSDRTEPRVLRTLDVDGFMSSARLLEDDLYVVLDTQAYLPSELGEISWEELPEPDWEASDEEQEALRAEARRILRPRVEEQVARTPITELLPRQYLAEPGETPTPAELLDCRDVYRPTGLSSPGVLSMAHLDLGNDDATLSATAVMASGWTVYASQAALYVAQSSFWWWWGWGDLDMDTHIHKFALEGQDSSYVGSGRVSGWLWNQFAMSEHDGHLRVATTDVDWWWGTQDDPQGGNNVFVLDEDLQVVGEVTGFAPGERIYSSRFLGDEGYVVTFRQVDPLFTFDLSDPADPRILGELKIPGFSSYLHPYGEGRLLGVGMDGDDDGQIHGLAINLFDVSDLSDPQRIDMIVVESDDWSWSEALWNHHAFTLHRDVLSLPIYTWQADEQTGHGEGFSGMMSVAVSEDALTEIGRVGHADLVDDSECLYGGYEEPGGECPDDYWWAGMRRSVVIEDNLFSISDYGIKITDLNDPMQEHARVLFWPHAAE